MKSAEDWFDGTIVFTESIALQIQIDALQEARLMTRDCCETDRQFAAWIKIDDLIVRLEANAPLK